MPPDWQPDRQPERPRVKLHSDPDFCEGCAVRLHEEGFHLSGIVLLDNASLGAA